MQRALDSVHGVDINPYAVAIARFRLLLAALKECGVLRLSDAPAFRMNVVCGDSLYHGRQRQMMIGEDWTDEAHYFRNENAAELRRILQEGTYHCVVANPPYITPKDRAANEAYRKLYPKTCHMKYSLAVPFMERIFRLAIGSRTRQSLADAAKNPKSSDFGYEDGESSRTRQSLAGIEKSPKSGDFGYVGQITANSFMKREFGKKLIESFFPTVDLTHVIDTSGAYIPGHGTPTVILFGRNRPPMASTLRTVMGIRGEPSTPADPAQGLVWSAIVAQVDQPGTQSEFVSVGDSPRELFHKHPWSIGGGGASELKERLEELCSTKLAAQSQVIGITAVTGEDELYMQPLAALRRRGIDLTRRLVVGDVVRDWKIDEGESSIWLYDERLGLIKLDSLPQTARLMWPYRAAISQRRRFGTPMIHRGLAWYEWQELYADKLRTPLSIVFGEVATHNHFVLDRGGKVFKQTAPVIKLPREAREDDHLALLGLLNSSTACFWMKQVCHNKGSAVDQHGARQRTAPFEDFFAFNGTKLQQFPLPSDRPLILAKLLDEAARARQGFLPASVLTLGVPTRQSLALVRASAEMILGRMIAAQEDLDWQCYGLYGLIDEDLHSSSRTRQSLADLNDDPGDAPKSGDFGYGGGVPHVALGQRAFEIVLARKMAAGEMQTTWFERHGSTPITELPAEWPDDYRQLVERRIALIASDPSIRLIEQLEYKRRWNTEPWESQLESALREWLLDRLESYFDFDGRMRDVAELARVWPICEAPQSPATSAIGQTLASSATDPPPLADIALVSIARLADVARQDAEFQQVGELYRDDPAFDVQALVAELVAAESVPLLPVLRYKPSGLIKRGTWERTWELQREEDELSRQSLGDAPSSQSLATSATGEEVRSRNRQSLPDSNVSQSLATSATSSIPVPTKYDSKDFLDSTFWRLRGKLDVPKERWISFPHCEGPDGTPVIAWAGYDHLQQARAISAYYVRIQTEFGGTDDARLIPLLACLIELLPWLKQWHNEPDAAFDGMRMGDYFEGFVNEEARQLNKTLPEIKAWQPPKKTARKKRK